MIAQGTYKTHRYIIFHEMIDSFNGAFFSLINNIEAQKGFAVYVYTLTKVKSGQIY